MAQLIAIAANAAAILLLLIATFGLPEPAISPLLLAGEVVPYGLGLLVLFTTPARPMLWLSLVSNVVAVLFCGIILWIVFVGDSAAPLLVFVLVLLLGCVPLTFNVYFAVVGLRK